MPMTIPRFGRALSSNLLRRTQQSKPVQDTRQLSALCAIRTNHCQKSCKLQFAQRQKQHCEMRMMSTQNLISVENGETIIRSNYPDIQEVETPFGEFMFTFLDKYKHLELLVNYPTGQTYTGAQIKEAVIKTASSLYKQGYRKGDVALLISPNCPEYTIVFIACACIGIVVSTANPIYTAGELARQISHSGSKTVFCSVGMVPNVKEAIATSKELQDKVKIIFTIDGEAHGCRPLKNLLEDSGSEFPENLDFDTANDVFTLPYSSGTTGLPKGVMLTHRSLVNNLVQAMEGQMKFKADEDILMGLLPFYHIYGLTVMQFSSLTQGSKLIVHPKFDPETFLQSIQKHKITYSHLVPPVVLFLAKHPMVENFDVSTIHTIISAAAPLGSGVSLEVEERLNVNLIQGYGMTEASPLTHYDETPPKRGTIGRLIPSTRAKIVDPETGKSLGVGETGEILVKGPQLMKGYLNNKEATDKTIKDGWLHSGDLGHVDSEGYFIISDRLKELIKYKGYQVAPAELEAVLCTHPGIQDAAVIGVQAGEDVGEIPKAFVVVKPGMNVAPAELEAVLCTHPGIQDVAVIGVQAGEDVGEIPKAFVVVKPGMNVSETDVLQFVEKNVAPYKKLRGGVVFTDQIPKTASGKTLRRMLK